MSNNGEESMSDYADIANLSWDEIQAPALLPVGSYLLKSRNASYQPSKEEGKSPTVMFVYQPKEAMEDVKSDELDELGADYDISENKIFHRFYIEDGSSWDVVRKHLEKHGVTVEGGVLETLKKFKGTEVVAYLDQRSFTNKTTGAVVTQNVATEFAPVE